VRRATGFAAAVRAATGGRGADIVLEPRHGRWIMESYRALARGGRLVLHGFASAASAGAGPWAALRTLARVPWLRLNPVALMNDNKGRGHQPCAHVARDALQSWMGHLLVWLAAARSFGDRPGLSAAQAGARVRLQRRENIGRSAGFRDRSGS
jgi:NADPH:quinone reductase-like Zn-dependent oxidoreductase